MRWKWLAQAIVVFLIFALSGQASAEDAAFQALKERAAEYFKAERYGDAVAVCEEWVQAAEKKETLYGKLAYATADALGNLAWHAIFANNPEKALVASQRAVTLVAPDKTFAEINLAHGLLFLGRVDSAIKVYTDHKGETVHDHRKWEEIVQSDFAQLRSHGLDRPDMARIEKALAEALPSIYAQDVDALNALDKKAEAFSNEGKVVEATETAKQALALAEQKFGPAIIP